MGNPPDIEVYADGRPPSTRSSFLAGRRLPVAAGLAVVEVIVIFIWGPGLILSTLLAAMVLVAATWASFTIITKGFARDLLWIIALAQGMVVAIPLLFGASFILAIVVGGLLIAGVVLFFIRTRF